MAIVAIEMFQQEHVVAAPLLADAFFVGGIQPRDADRSAAVGTSCGKVGLDPCGVQLLDFQGVGSCGEAAQYDRRRRHSADVRMY